MNWWRNWFLNRWTGIIQPDSSIHTFVSLAYIFYELVKFSYLLIQSSLCHSTMMVFCCRQWIEYVINRDDINFTSSDRYTHLPFYFFPFSWDSFFSRSSCRLAARREIPFFFLLVCTHDLCRSDSRSTFSFSWLVNNCRATVCVWRFFVKETSVLCLLAESPCRTAVVFYF